MLGQTLQFVLDQGEPTPPDAADLYRGLGELFLERGDLESAAQYLSKSRELGGKAEQLGWQYRLCIAEAHLKQVQGDRDGALALLYEAERLVFQDPVARRASHPGNESTDPGSCRAGRRKPMGWARERGLSVDDDLGYLREYEHVTLARILLAGTGMAPMVPSRR